MQITVNLRDAAHDPDVARPLVVALLSALPQDAADLAVAEWQAVARFRQFDEAEQLAAISIAETLPTDAEPKAFEKKKSPDDGTPLEDCLSAKTAGALKRAGFQNLGDLSIRSGKFLLGTVDRFGKAGLDEVQQVMTAAGLSLASDDGPFVPQRDATTTPDVPSTGNGGAPTDDATTADMSIRELVRKAEHEVGREKVWAIFMEHGIGKLTAITPDCEPAFRASLIEAMS